MTDNSISAITQLVSIFGVIIISYFNYKIMIDRERSNRELEIELLLKPRTLNDIDNLRDWIVKGFKNTRMIIAAGTSIKLVEELHRPQIKKDIGKLKEERVPWANEAYYYRTLISIIVPTNQEFKDSLIKFIEINHILGSLRDFSNETEINIKAVELNILFGTLLTAIDELINKKLSEFR